MQTWLHRHHRHARLQVGPYQAPSQDAAGSLPSGDPCGPHHQTRQLLAEAEDQLWQLQIHLRGESDLGLSIPSPYPSCRPHISQHFSIYRAVHTSGTAIAGFLGCCGLTSSSVGKNQAVLCTVGTIVSEGNFVIWVKWLRKNSHPALKRVYVY